MKLEQLTSIKRENSKLEQSIWESLQNADKETEIYGMSGDFLINAMNMSKRPPEKMAVAINVLLQKKEDEFGELASFAYYVSSLQFWSFLMKEGEPDADMKEVIANVDQEVDRCKDIVFYYLIDVLDQKAFLDQIMTFCKNFNISEDFHKSLKAYLIQYQAGISEQLLVKLSDEQ